MPTTTLKRLFSLVTTTPTPQTPQAGDCPQGGEHQWKAEKTGVGIIYTCQKCGAWR